MVLYDKTTLFITHLSEKNMMWYKKWPLSWRYDDDFFGGLSVELDDSSTLEMIVRWEEWTIFVSLRSSFWGKACY